MRGKSESMRKQKYASPQKQAIAFRTGESNGSLSTKPATSTTLNSSTRKEGTEEAKCAGQGKKQPQKGAVKRETKRRVAIFHEGDEVHKTHRINKAINTINNIIRLIFKNNKDSLAITTTTNNSSLSGPTQNRLIDDNKIAELQKIARQININIPKKFESKSSLREFFYSREFILTVKIKMNNLLHRAIL
mgnify:CR=1 FL=1